MASSDERSDSKNWSSSLNSFSERGWSSCMVGLFIFVEGASLTRPARSAHIFHRARLTIAPMETPKQHPFANLTPECVLDALESVGQFADGRLLALNSYENRVYQIGMEEGPPVVAKF